MENLAAPPVDTGQLMAELLTLSDNEVIVPLRVDRKDVTHIKGLKFTDAEIVKLEAFQKYLFSRGYIKADTYADMSVYCFNLTYTLHDKYIIGPEIEREGGGQ